MFANNNSFFSFLSYPTIVGFLRLYLSRKIESQIKYFPTYVSQNLSSPGCHEPRGLPTRTRAPPIFTPYRSTGSIQPRDHDPSSITKKKKTRKSFIPYIIRSSLSLSLPCCSSPLPSFLNQSSERTKINSYVQP